MRLGSRKPNGLADSYFPSSVLPRPFLPDPAEVCLFVKDLQRGIRPDHEETLVETKRLLEEKGVDQVAEVIPLRQLKVEFKQYEAKMKLSNRFDKFLADERIVRLLPKFIGKAFYKRKRCVWRMASLLVRMMSRYTQSHCRFPTQVNLKAKDLRSEIEKGLRTTHLPLSHHGTCAMTNVGNTRMSDQDLASNIVAASQVLAKRCSVLN